MLKQKISSFKVKKKKKQELCTSRGPGDPQTTKDTKEGSSKRLHVTRSFAGVISL